jgi:peroxiredoxin
LLNFAMAALNTPACDFGRPAPDFSLPGTDGHLHTLASCCGENGLLVAFICNHCPYVQAILDRLIRDASELQQHGVGVVAISSNDVSAYPEDAFPEMVRLAEDKHFPFPYLHDESQAVARAYGAVCTPDFFGFDRSLGLQYRGRLDASGRYPAAADMRRELFEAMCAVAESGHGPHEQWPSIGCSLKWK